IGRSILAATGVVTLVLTVLVVLARLIREVDDVGQADYGWLAMLAHIALKTPTDLLYVMPVIVLLGALMALGALAGGRELIVLRSAGVSMARLAAAVSIAGIALAILVSGVVEFAGPAGTRIGDQLRHNALHDARAQTLGEGVWLRQNAFIVRIGGLLDDELVQDIDIYKLDDSGQLLAAMRAARGRMREQGLELIEPEITRISIEGTETLAPESKLVDIELGPDVLALATVKPARQSSIKLWHYIRYMQANNINADDYRLALWRNLVTPFTIWFLVLFALPFAFGALRGSGAGQRLFFGGLLGLLFYLVNEIVAASGMVYGLPPWLAASLPTLVLGAGTLYWIHRLD